MVEQLPGVRQALALRQRRGELAHEARGRAALQEHRQGLHVNADHLRVELGDPATPAGDAGPREVLVTDLFNYGMPLMRYANGDLATASASDAACPCGRGLPVLASVDGRRMDALRTPEGHYVGEYLEYLMFTTPGVRRFQAVQERIDRIDVAVVGGEELADDALDQVRRRMIDAFGSSVELAFARTGELPLTPTGKLRVAVSKLAHCVWMTLLHAVEAMVDRRRPYGRGAWGLLCLELWRRAFLDGPVAGEAIGAGGMALGAERQDGR